MNSIPAKFLKEATDLLAYPLSNITNLLVKLSRRNYFPGESKIAKPKPLFKKGSKTNPKTTDLFHFYHWYPKLLINQYNTNYKILSKGMAYSTKTNQVLANVFLLIRVWCNLRILF